MNRSTRATVSSGSIVAVAMMVMNVATYGFNLLAARQLVPAEFGALTALLSLTLIANVVALGLQASIARRISVRPGQTIQIVHTASRVALALSLLVGLATALSSPILTPAFSFDSVWAVIWCGAMLVPLTLAGAQLGVAQGTGRWGKLAALYLGNGFGRLFGGLAGLAIEPTATNAMMGLAIGSWLPVILGMGLLKATGGGDAHSRRPLVFETVTSASTLLAYFAFSNVDALIARGGFDAHDSGLYASGLILTKSTLFLPQFVSVVFFPSLARDSSHRTRLRAVGLVALLGVAVVAGAAVLPKLALILVGGDQYAEITGDLWLFAVSGTFLAIVYLLVFDALARREGGVAVLVWIATATVFCVAYFNRIGIVGLVTTMAITAAALSAVLLVWPLIRRTPEPKQTEVTEPPVP
ncbi:polysaccharide biosynthesis protein [Aeromicrobium sp. 636]|uniref:Polysaccharide biosynthesis protein n=1 Tax=Aeromicrobium senzhongii TaxID=2663859 RepID=A0A8I0ETG8_9ACTN|nr:MULTISPECIES: polysaccharide biosynthesis protein [Aeromicrobium]MBC9224822.1 polysaccharide biosynthesis protein [Aeromicrobium senzhongii]MCQ3996935.1 polysaccharide biosynthesis protein [Aeromicrobium sp. 636]MTB86869.1 polysaccharide biosynthesis protein [Aeromicrobium senzhongii]QNL93296.1 polysaccharide biosynthesis protein [Aeromicrobium senzhongii]